MARPTEIRRLAEQIHRCPKGYHGPCWGPTPEDIEKAKALFAEAEAAYPDHAPTTALANYRAGREVWDTNGDLR